LRLAPSRAAGFGAEALSFRLPRVSETVCR
jgi:hypothetical protein